MDFRLLLKSKTTAKSMSKNLSGKYSQKLLDGVKKSATDALETGSKKVMQKTAEATGDFLGDKITDKITKPLRTSPNNNSETVTTETENIGLDRKRSKYTNIYVCIHIWINIHIS